MTRYAAPLLILLSLACGSSHAQVADARPTDSALAAKLGADARGMRNYVLVILKSGPERVADGPARVEMFKGHFANMERLALIPNFQAVSNASDLLTSPKMDELVQTLEGEAPRRIVIFDMPPLLASDDVLAFAPQFDSLLLVVSEGKSGRAMLRGAKEVLSEMNLLGVALNRSKERNESAYY